MKDLTEKQLKILAFIEEFMAENRYPPTIREVGDKFEITAKGAYDHLKAIEKKGYIKSGRNRSRAIEVLKTSTGSAPVSVDQIISIPLIGRVAAGTPILAQENVEEYLSFPRSMVPSGSNVFALRVAGDSMIEAGIHNGDIAVVHQQNTADNGDIVVALLEDEATLKYFYKERKKVRLEPANKAYKPIVVSNVTVVGKLIGIYRNF